MKISSWIALILAIIAIFIAGLNMYHTIEANKMKKKLLKEMPVYKKGDAYKNAKSQCITYGWDIIQL